MNELLQSVQNFIQHLVAGSGSNQSIFAYSAIAILGLGAFFTARFKALSRKKTPKPTFEDESEIAAAIGAAFHKALILATPSNQLDDIVAAIAFAQHNSLVSQNADDEIAAIGFAYHQKLKSANNL